MPEKTGLSIPCQWDKDSLIEILNYRMDNGIDIKEVYGTLSFDSLPHGRAFEVTKKIKKNDALEIKKIISEKGITFAYLINAPIELDSYEFLENDLDWIVNVFKADSITISSLKLMKFVRTKYPDLKINVSTIAGVKTVEDMKHYLSINPSKFITHHDVNRNFKDLEEIIEFLKIQKIDFEVMVNESCLRRCAKRDEHYSTLGKGCGDSEFHLWCNSLKVTYPYQFLMSNFIRPEDLRFYEEKGIKLFKVTGRSKPLGWLQEVVKAYLNREYDGNLIRLLGVDPKLEAERFVYISNKALENFLEKFPQNGDIKEEIRYCNRVVSELFKKNQLKIKSDLAKPEIKDTQISFKIEKDIYSKSY
ncbi:U32 family peptidase [Ruminiclostridium josui]|uniref:U32 family peptidase n=1 Tax=Ruminiclostridium josui TaxID=1499 RepID=UPI0004632BF4|nr:U32 family peptidase [Ruminiclostridium josui]